METEVTYPIDSATDSYEADACPVLYALSIVGQKWKLPILWHLFEKEVTRYNELKRSVGNITNMMLTKSLQELERDGLVVRHQYNVIPPRVEYALTDRGKALLPTLNELYNWGKEQMEGVQETKQGDSTS